MALVQRIVDTCIAVAHRNGANKINVINLEIGDFSLIIDQMFRHCFEIVSKNTIVEGAVLQLNRTPGVILCDACQKTSEIWYDAEKTPPNVDSKDAMAQYEKNLTASDVLSKQSSVGNNLFQCRQCGSRNTTLIRGKSIVIKNIQV
jgi:hydrogenase nickel insertion protein HypA